MKYFPLNHCFTYSTFPLKSQGKVNNHLKNTQGGFTLVELLTVIAIIGILATVVLAAINPAARFDAAYDSGRKADLGQMRDALAAYAAQHNGQYPKSTYTYLYDCGSCTTDSGTGSWLNGPVGDTNWIAGLVSGGYIKRLPRDPRTDAGPGFGYMYKSDGNGYKIYDPNGPRTFLEPDIGNKYCTNSGYTRNNLPLVDPFEDPPHYHWAYSVYSSDSEACW